MKEVSLSLLNGLILAVILFEIIFFGCRNCHRLIVTLALMSVIIIASLIGTFVPLLLDKFGLVFSNRAKPRPVMISNGILLTLNCSLQF
jgi:Mg/Co/Ni transporter MgtE